MATRDALRWAGSALLLAAAAATSAGQSPFAPPAAASTSRPSSSPEELIALLGGDTYAARQAAQEGLVKMGAGAAEALRQAIASNKLNLEADSRARWILALVDVPQAGAVYRPVRGRATHEGLLDGDVVVKFGRLPVANANDLQRVAAMPEQQVLTVWRRGKGTFQAVLGQPPDVGCFWSWPDALELHERFSAGGRWDEDLRRAVRLSYAGKTDSAPSYRRAWGAGCRHSLLVYLWLCELLAERDLKAADGLVRDVMPKAEPDRSPGKVWQYGFLPLARTHLELARGERRGAEEILGAAAGEAERADAFLGLGVIRYAQAEIELSFAPLEEAAAFWRRHSADVLRFNGRFTTNLIDVMAARLAFERGSRAAVSFLEGMDDCLPRRLLPGFYARQATLAPQGAAASRPTTLNWLPVLFRSHLGSLEAKLDRTDQVHLCQRPAPLRIECRVRIAQAPAERSEKARLATVHLAGSEGGGNGGAVLRLLRAGQVEYDSLTPWRWAYVRGAQVLDPNRWHAMTIEALPAETTAWLDGRACWHEHLAGRYEGNLYARLSCSGCRAEFQNISVSVASSAPVDRAAVLAELARFERAMKAADAPAAEAATRALLAAWRPVAAAEPFAARLRGRLAMLREFASPAGMPLCTAELLGEQRNQPATLAGATLTLGSEDGPQLIALPFEDFELAGALEARAFGRQTLLCISWGGAACNAGNQMAYWPAGGKLLMGSTGGGSWPVQASAGGRGAPAPFCLRVKGAQAALFTGDGKLPAGKLANLPECCANIVLEAKGLSAGGLGRFIDLRLRAVAPERRLTDPARMSIPAADAR